MKRFLFIAGIGLTVTALIVAAAGYFYWRSFEDTPQYSLALLIEASRKADNKAFAEFVDTDAVVEDFVPQVTSKAGEMYGRGLPPVVLAQLANIAAPVMPKIKERARAELPRLLREETERFADIPFAAMVLGAEKYLDISIEGENAAVRSKLPEHGFEVRMQRNGEKWKIVGVRDEALATRIAQTLGEQLIGAATSTDLKKAGETIGVSNLESLIKQAERLFE